MEQLPSYATVAQVEAGFRPLSTEESSRCTTLIQEAGIMIDAAAKNASADAKMLVTCRMVRRVLGSNASDVPLGAINGTVSALGYSQTWAMASGGGSGELYIGKSERAILGVGNRIGASNPYMEVNEC